MMHLISNKLVEFIEEHSEIIVKEWMNQILGKTISSVTKDNINFIRKKADSILKHLKQWVSYDTTKVEIGKRFAEEGKEFFNRGIPLCEIYRSTVLLRRTLWLFVVNEGGFDSAFQLHQMRELNDRVILFFDRAHYYVVRGYMEEMNKKMKELWKLSDKDIENVLFQDSFYNR